MDLPARGLDLPPVVETARLVLRPLRLDDAPAVVRGIGDVEVACWLGTAPHPYSEADARAFIEAPQAASGVWAIAEGAALRGIVSIRSELGYWLARDAWGRGLATEAARAAARAWFAAGPALLMSSHMERNDASRRVLLKLGFEDTGPRTIRSAALGRDVPGRAMRLNRTAFEAAADGAASAPRSAVGGASASAERAP